MANVVKFAFGLDPTVGGGPALQYSGSLNGGGTINGTGEPIAVFNSGDGQVYALFVRRIDYASAGLSYTLQFSSDLLMWQTSIATPDILAANGAYQIVSLPFPLGASDAYFFRVRVDIVP